MNEVSGEEGVYPETMYNIRGQQNKPMAFKVTVELCGEPHSLEIDTGAARTVLNEETYSKATSTLSRINLKTQLLPRKRIKCSPSTLIVFKLFRCPH